MTKPTKPFGRAGERVVTEGGHEFTEEQWRIVRLEQRVEAQGELIAALERRLSENVATSVTSRTGPAVESPDEPGGSMRTWSPIIDEGGEWGYEEVPPDDEAVKIAERQRAIDEFKSGGRD